MDSFLSLIRRSPLSSIVKDAAFVNVVRRTIEELDSQVVLDVLTRELSGSDPPTQYFACRYLAEALSDDEFSDHVGNTQLLSLVLRVTHSQHEELRTAAVNALGRLDAPSHQVAVRFVELIDDTSASISSYAALYVARTAPDFDGLVELLRQRAQGRDVAVAGNAIWSLAELGKRNEQGIAALIELLQDGSWGFAPLPGGQTITFSGENEAALYGPPEFGSAADRD
jgi:hypothetical protein